ncbi:hemolysin family protein [Jeotgalibaca ciconiae]|uniref:HlyC/CorC family transporter n=1 Tax=Jeotgalibaca ciconiae TaxID=2496265 RepID=A0A3S9H9N7_9LACT|nr:hemolysin family protein [Jeotgalibaca ciconiae]AZP04068.1 HlyC/CorC family transporter [Jeotgalibaca ciconiae]HJB23287.1 hemolysin family protein [Candidatus Jeotgalibaca pullicola]
MNADPEAQSLLANVMVVVILTIVNAFFASAELAYVSINRKKIEAMAEEGDRKALRVLKLLEEPDDFLATIQVAITLAGFFNSASASSNFVPYLEPLLGGISGWETIATVIITILLSYITLVLGELYPKQIALQMPEQLARMTSGTIAVVKVIAKPFVWLLSASTNLLKKLSPIDFSKQEEKLTRDEMRQILAQSRGQGAIDPSEFTMMEGVLSLDTRLARELMVPRTDTLMLDLEDDLSENVEIILDSPYSRMPVYDGDKDEVIGVLHMKNVLKASKEVGFDALELRTLVNEPLFVPSTIFIDDLLVEFRKQQTHMAILKDEYGGVEGIVTLEDVLEEIVGDIEDEYDEIQRLSRKMDDENYIINGKMNLQKFNQLFKTELSSHEVDTIGGLMIEEIGYFPDDNERVSVRINGYLLTTSRVENGRIHSIHVERIDDPDEDAKESEEE